VPRRRFVLLGTLLLAACGASNAPLPAAAPPSAPPTAAPAVSQPVAGGWLENLSFSGDVSGTATATAPDDAVLKSECTGRLTARGGTWAGTFVLAVAGKRYALVMLLPAYEGPVTYNDSATLELHSGDLQRVWETMPGDTSTVSVAADEASGNLQARLSSTADPSKKVAVSGLYTCRA
jgi:hypothetical protein